MKYEVETCYHSEYFTFDWHGFSFFFFRHLLRCLFFIDIDILVLVIAVSDKFKVSCR